jgi:hypothetical protein
MDRPTDDPRPPEPVARVSRRMENFGPARLLCGGWAVDGWLGRQTRDHGDVDLCIFRGDERAAFDHLVGWQLVAHDTPDADHADPWDGRLLDFPAHIHATSADGFKLELHLNERSNGDWILCRDPRLTVALGRAAQQTAWGLPILVPELLLFYKARDVRAHDVADFHALLPRLTDSQRSWLAQAVSIVHPGHAWLPELPPLARDDAVAR